MLIDYLNQTQITEEVLALEPGYGLAVHDGQVWKYRGQRYVYHWLYPISSVIRKTTKRGRRRKNG